MSIQCPNCLIQNPDSAEYCIICSSPLQTNVCATTYHLPSGTLLKQGKYRIEKVLGEGGFGITYKATYLPNLSPIAIKELWPEKAARQGTKVTWPYSILPKDRQQQLDKFKLEASYLCQCNHLNIVKVDEWFDENNTVYIVMEFIAGKSLSAILKAEGKLPENRIKHYFLQIAEALKVVHSHNFLHRDIKPDNILIDNQDRAVLIDFGATKEFIAGQTREMSVTLTQGYAPLEQYSYKSRRWAATDLYALCASMYELLTGELPAEAVSRVQSETLIPPRKLCPDISESMEKVILTGLKIRVEDRFQTADELIDALNGNFNSLSQKIGQELTHILHQGVGLVKSALYGSELQTLPVPNAPAKLIVKQIGAPITEFLLDGKNAIIGIFDFDTGQVSINLKGFPGSETVSRNHAEIYQENGVWKIKDLGSSNGVFLKPAGESRFGARITSPQAINSGDEIAIAKVRFLFQIKNG